MMDPPIDDMSICPACDGSGVGVADTQCGLCAGCGGVPSAHAQALAREAFDAGFAIGSIVEGWTSEKAWAVSKIKRRLDNGDQHE